MEAPVKRRKFFAACASALASAFVPADVSAAPLVAPKPPRPPAPSPVRYAGAQTGRWTGGIHAREVLRDGLGFVDIGAIERVNIRVRVHT